MQETQHNRSTREQIFLIAIGVFLLTYLITLTRTRTMEWVVIASTVALGITVIAGLLITEVIVPPSTEEAAAGEESETAGTMIDFTLEAEDEDQSEDASEAVAAD